MNNLGQYEKLYPIPSRCDQQIDESSYQGKGAVY